MRNRWLQFVLISMFVNARIGYASADNTLNVSTNQSYLSDYAKKAGVISLPDGLKYRIIRRGIGRTPVLSDVVKIAYTGRLINGTIFDGTSPGLPISVGLSSLIAGVREALLAMHEGDHWEVVVPASLGFGPENSKDGVIPANQTLVFDLALVTVTAPSQALPSNGALPFSIITSGRQQSAVMTIHP